MAVDAATQALVAAFFFGLVLSAASAAVVLCTRGRGRAPFRDSQRLALVLFLSSSALWALLDFITVLLDGRSRPTSCQVGVTLSTIFDQLARFSIEQFLLCATDTNNHNGSKVSPAQLIPQVVVLARFLAGAVFIGFARPQTDSFCVATTSIPPLGIAIPALDAAIIILLVVRAYAAGRVAKETGNGKGAEADRANALMSVLLGLALWTGTSVPLLLGIKSIALALRTALPAGGLLVVIVLASAGAGTLLAPRSTSMPPEAPSPRRIDISRDMSTSDSGYPPSRYQDLKEAAVRSSTAFVNPREAPRAQGETVVGSAGERGKMAIGNPILLENTQQNPLNKMAVVDLQEAAAAEKERRDRTREYGDASVSRRDEQSRRMTAEEGARRAGSVKRKEVASVSLRQSALPGVFQHEGVGLALTTSAQPSPGGDETRLRSPRQSVAAEPPTTPVQVTGPSQDRPLVLRPHLNVPQQTHTRLDLRPSRTLPASPQTMPPEPAKTPLQRRPTVGLPTNPRAQGLLVAQEPGAEHKTVLFVNNIDYNDPRAVEAIIKGASDKATKAAPLPGLRASVVDRPRPISRKAADSSAQSPTPSHRRSRPAGSSGRTSPAASAPGSPTPLPPLPPLPKGVLLPPRPRSNDTRSMAFQEKITLLFPNPPRGNMKRGSSPIAPAAPVRASAWTESTDDRSDDDATTNWSRVQSSELTIGVPVGQATGLPAAVRMCSRQDAQEPKAGVALTDSRNSGTLPIMLDTSAVQPTDLQSPWFSDRELVATPAGVTPGSATPDQAAQSQWHRRVGDDCPTFSGRKAKTRLRKLAPTPLMLNSPPSLKVMAIQAAPSPLETPGQALQQIQAQLKKLEMAQQDSPESAAGRCALLENLEHEMGEQAEHWKEMRHDFERGSMSSMQTTSPPAKSTVRESPGTTKATGVSPRIGPGHRASHVARQQNNPEVNSPASVQDSVCPQLNKWQKRLTEAHLEYMDAQVFRSSNVDFPQLSRAPLASPTPPDSDEPDRSADELLLPRRLADVVAEPPEPALLLWISSAPGAKTPAGFLWTPPAHKTTVRAMEQPLPALVVRPAQRTAPAASLHIASSQLWRKPHNTAPRATTGLWRPRRTAPTPSRTQSQSAPRQRPARRHTRRVTLLPDIPESPKPLSAQGGTLGVFQFPWGAGSDAAPVPPMGMASPPQQQFEAAVEYPSSFFDDYDDDEDGGDGDDAFDETTLWEIASLLKSDAVPSRDSLLPPRARSAADGDGLASDQGAQPRDNAHDVPEQRARPTAPHAAIAPGETPPAAAAAAAESATPPPLKHSRLPSRAAAAAQRPIATTQRLMAPASAAADAGISSLAQARLMEEAEATPSESRGRSSSALWTPPARRHVPAASVRAAVGLWTRGFRGAAPVGTGSAAEEVETAVVLRRMLRRAEVEAVVGFFGGEGLWRVGGRIRPADIKWQDTLRD
ncbi:hypothetical protein BT67DRAFT_436665 [Trichocladium antarcticum]|uniref:Uncharacterized protein n=1 Tax=Trichocladium antarcticum TaxID=1450529 RepID=A0AAN6UG41_9PEZI|nr:hypothetical protein BT67DRAFT_436665 [Trichocladium antarcticum]